MAKIDLDKVETEDSPLKEATPEMTQQKRGNSYDPVQIYDTTCNKIRNAREFKISSFEETDVNGDVQIKKSVEFVIVGNNRTWKLFIPYDEFVKANPAVSLPGDK